MGAASAIMPRHPVPLLPENLESGLRSSHLPALDGLRAVAVFLVVFYHFGIRAAPGGLGVIIFFVLSGFLITWLLLAEDERFGTVSVRKFCARRFLRICPVFYFYWLLLTVLLLLLHKKIVWEQAIASALFASNYYQAILGDPNTGFSHTWALSVVAQFYLLWPAIFLALRKDRIRLAKALAGIILAVWAYRGLLHSVLGVAQGYVFEAFDTRADHLAIGCLLAVMLRSGLLSGFWRTVCSGPAMGLVTAFLLASSTLAENLGGVAYRDTVGFVVNPVLSAIMIAQLIAFRRSTPWSWIDWKWMRYLGRISYSIYLYQQIVIEPSTRALLAYPRAVQLAGCVASVIAAASISHFLVENPSLRIKNRLQRTPSWSTPRAA